MNRKVLFLTIDIVLSASVAVLLAMSYLHYARSRIYPETTFGRLAAVMGPESLQPVVVIFLSVCLTVCVILFIYMQVIRNRRLNRLYLFGIFYLLIFLISMMWELGDINRIYTLIPPTVFDWLVYGMTCLGPALLFAVRSRDDPENFRKKQRKLVYLLLSLQIIVRIVAAILKLWQVLWIVPVLLILWEMGMWTKAVSRKINTETLSYTVTELGTIFLFLASLLHEGYLDLKLEFLMTTCYPVCLILYLACVFSVFLIYHGMQARQLQAQLAMEQEMSRMQAALMASQMQPHFLYNSLTAIQELCYTAPEKAAQLIVRFSNYLRTSIDFMDYRDTIPFNAELEFIRNYMYIQQERFGEELIYREEIGYTAFELPPFSVQPLIENAINYGVRSEHSDGVVELKVKRKSGHVCITVANTGEELKEESLREYHSIRNIRKRLQTSLQGELDLFYDPGQRRVEVQVRIPLPSEE